ncbi:nuclear transport factor 2 family protein [Kordiimonas sp. SCSIO 12610]|uniref:nuclear transport factor 2 family protein n=1 Tax=Kordiimonas sp. SCSIO 12610 TaxID=2829597 RepID=UPI00210B5DD1|nr:nuclear transport factor 2 family protein [Kordiimonas sp. SCSIO 12610]UTW56480.1 nuclear transport factor 2 family protein [Kordiimonas sp. SCSIO 12610]
MFRSLLMASLILLGFSLTVIADSEADRKAIDATLDGVHRHASTGDWNEYFDLYTKDAVFMGTDITERWDMPTFMAYAKERPSGWHYWAIERHVDFTPDGNSAWFDEILDNEKYGKSRGTGVLVRTQNGWKVAQYHLTFPIPNDIFVEVIKDIRAFEAKVKTEHKD